ncbi:AP2 domain-containing protein [Mammaliicoccus vitulinus]|uniref:AP2 domain-containing protein n=1 Tax=Mammaliicoccus vitulinus TaxID=71237 RepID=UPI003F9CA77C
MVKSIYLQDGEEIFVDDEDYERVSQYTWYKSFKGNSRTIKNMQTKFLSTFILKGSHQIIGNNDFTRSNLTKKGNAHRYKKAKYSNSSKYKGVSWSKRYNKWISQIETGEKRKYLGVYVNEDDAARAYNQAVLEYWDGNGYINVIGEDNRQPIREYGKKGQHIKRYRPFGYRGVSKVKGKNSDKFSSHIFFDKNNRNDYLGTFPTKHHAALTFNKCSIYIHGDDAILNDVPMTDELKEFIDNWEVPEKIKRLKEDN